MGRPGAHAGGPIVATVRAGACVSTAPARDLTTLLCSPGSGNGSVSFGVGTMGVMPDPTAQPDEREPSINLGAGLAGLVLPGLGHMITRRVWRGAGAMTGVLGLFFLGLLIGGIDAVDSRSGADRLWFIGQAFVGPIAFAVDHAHQNYYKAHDPATGVNRTGYPYEHRVREGGRWVWERLSPAQIESGLGPPNEPGLGRLNEIAMLSCTLAGMLNVIVVFDAAIATGYGRRRADDEGAADGDSEAIGGAS